MIDERELFVSLRKAAGDCGLDSTSCMARLLDVLQRRVLIHTKDLFIRKHLRPLRAMKPVKTALNPKP